ncbi:methyltransferase domain-containing protein [Alteromonas sp. C1M14]|uniref:methyltransferase domain-containing protein n=1 Tax=Alteromonas sp. C1M14 TaxID=2841567 RepID=UPI001C099CE1|nr:methyltransferase domain-containing protein [Alteromonas sp. C1M14]MBU2976952.1 methyltransferase domain-containing protein [Alteromonas sp. C1M14]
MKETDQIFDGIADKFVKNIYGTTKGKLRHLLLLEALKETVATASPLNIADVGGGSGIMTKAMAEEGHHVTLFDASEDILTIAREYLQNVPNVTITPGEIQALTTLSSFDLLICHAVLEWLAAPLEAISLFYDQMQPGSYLSLSFFNKDAALFSNALYGNFDYIAKGMKVKNQVRLNPTNPLKPKAVIEHAQGAGFVVEKMAGIRCFHDYMKDKSFDDQQFKQLVELERRYMFQAPYYWLGKYFYLLLKKPG